MNADKAKKQMNSSYLRSSAFICGCISADSSPNRVRAEAADDVRVGDVLAEGLLLADLFGVAIAHDGPVIESVRQPPHAIRFVFAAEQARQRRVARPPQVADGADAHSLQPPGRLGADAPDF